MIRYLLHISVLLSLIVLSSMADARTEGSARDLPERSHRDKILTQKLKKNISLNDLISASGYSISDEVIVNFLGDFMSLNPSVKSISTLKKDTLVRIPLKHLKRIAESQETSVDKPAGSSLRKQFIRRKPKAAEARVPLCLKSILKLDAYVNRTVEPGGDVLELRGTLPAGRSKTLKYKAPEIPRSEAYGPVRRRDEG